MGEVEDLLVQVSEHWETGQGKEWDLEKIEGQSVLVQVLAEGVVKEFKGG